MTETNRLPRCASLPLLALVLLLAACAGREPPPLPPEGGAPAAEDRTADEREARDGPDIDTSRLNERGLLGIEQRDRTLFLDPDNPLSTRVIHFEFDSSRIQPHFREAIEAHANYLAEHPDARLRLEGHTDERGTREYNIALGERRAESVQQALVIAGAGVAQLTTLSFGEERPAERGSGAEAYAANRRVELVYVE